jgi:hypothetical protein
VVAPEREGWRPPISQVKLCLRAETPTKEDADEEVCRARRAQDKHDVRGDGRERQAAQDARGGDERPGARRAAQDDPRSATCLRRGGDAERLDLRDPVAARGRDRGERDLGEPRPEGRRARRLRPRGEASDRGDRAARVQGGGRVQDAPRARPDARDDRAGRGPSEEPDPSYVPVARGRGERQNHLLGQRARSLAAQAGRGTARSGEHPVRALRRDERSAQAGRESVRGEVSIDCLAQDDESGGPTARLCPLGVPKEAMARRGPDRRMVPAFEARTGVLRSRRGYQRRTLELGGATVIRAG